MISVLMGSAYVWSCPPMKHSVSYVCSASRIPFSTSPPTSTSAPTSQCGWYEFPAMADLMSGYTSFTFSAPYSTFTLDAARRASLSDSATTRPHGSL